MCWMVVESSNKDVPIFVLVGVSYAVNQSVIYSAVSLLTTRNTYIYKDIRLYFHSWQWYLCGAEKQSQRVCAHEGVVGRRKSQWTTDFSRNSGTYILYNSHVTRSNSFFSLTMVTPTSHLFAFHWLCCLFPIGYLPKFHGRTHLPPSPNSATSTGQGDIPISSAGCTCFNTHRYTAPVGIMAFQLSYWSYQSICQQHPLYFRVTQLPSKATVRRLRRVYMMMNVVGVGWCSFLVFIICPTTGRIWHKAILRWVRSQGKAHTRPALPKIPFPLCLNIERISSYIVLLSSNRINIDLYSHREGHRLVEKLLLFYLGDKFHQHFNVRGACAQRHIFSFWKKFRPW